jgi:2-C-methyl-D-erythritol 2,4-cyclodiphosphate synthase
MNLLHHHGYRLGNADTTLCLQRPKIKDYVPRMMENLAKAMQTEVANVSVKATTHEKLGFVGQEKGLAAYAVVLVLKES